MEEQYFLQKTYDELQTLVTASDHDGARTLLKDRFAQLPEEVQGSLLVILLAEAIEMEAVGLDENLTIQNEGITALKALEEMKTVLQG
jgi:hypothetical protein